MYLQFKLSLLSHHTLQLNPKLCELNRVPKGVKCYLPHVACTYFLHFFSILLPGASKIFMLALNLEICFRSSTLSSALIRIGVNSLDGMHRALFQPAAHIRRKSKFAFR